MISRLRMCGREGRGAAPIELAVGILVILIPTALIALSFGPTLERRSFVRLAAAEVARYIALSEGDEVGALERLHQMATNNGIDPGDVRIGLCGGDVSRLTEALASSCLGPAGLGRGTEIEVWIEAAIRVTPIPRTDNAMLRAGYRHTEVVDRYRSVGP